MTRTPWSALLDPERLDTLRLLIALNPADSEAHDTARTAHLVLSRVLADMTDIEEASITAIIAAARASTGVEDDSNGLTLSGALEGTLRATLDHRLVLAMLAGAVLRSHDNLARMEGVGTGPGGYHKAQIDGQRRDAAMTLRAFRAWERVVDQPANLDHGYGAANSASSGVEVGQPPDEVRPR
ncbi:hypothetical protein [Pedococcus bigeumensis]|uniref:Uncharacterized protein n=1 Tax=Pedococcus bigeumensis TaxID=433644 RepID=A0A502CZJ6_9MICO|nr:hypothetical protein [Pedococcus bigeumensis]TPG17181.1 hypothetical protein EAH86_10485 [Pedococcus bigeumensis]